MPDTDALNAVISQQTVAYRKGAEVTKREVGDIQVVEVVGYPETPSHGELVDVHFINIGFTEEAADKQALVDALKQALTGVGEFGVTIDADRMRGGPSYIETGGWLGSQDQALRLYGLMQHHGLGTVVIPESMGVIGEAADALAGRGMVFIAGFDPEAL